jgi:hypothetical protein
MLRRSWFHQSLDRVHRQHQPKRLRQPHEAVSFIKGGGAIIDRVDHQH